MLVAFGVSAVVYVLTLSCVRTLACQFEPDRYLTLMASDVANVQYFSRLTTFQSVIIEFILQFAVDFALSPFLQLGQVTIPRAAAWTTYTVVVPPMVLRVMDRGTTTQWQLLRLQARLRGFF